MDRNLLNLEKTCKFSHYEPVLKLVWQSPLKMGILTPVRALTQNDSV